MIRILRDISAQHRVSIPELILQFSYNCHYSKEEKPQAEAGPPEEGAGEERPKERLKGYFLIEHKGVGIVKGNIKIDFPTKCLFRKCYLWVFKWIIFIFRNFSEGIGLESFKC